MREIKFRIWCEFEIGGKIEKSMESPASWFLLSQAGELWSYAPYQYPRPLEKAYRKAVPLFYVGIKDQNGKEIYEGDIVKVMKSMATMEGHQNIFVFAPVIFESGAFRFNMGDEAPLVHSSCEIIGNIYESPEAVERHYKPKEDP